MGEVMELGQEAVPLPVMLADPGDHSLGGRADESGHGDEQDRGPPAPGG